MNGINYQTMTEPGLNGNHGRDTMTMMRGWVSDDRFWRVFGFVFESYISFEVGLKTMDISIYIFLFFVIHLQFIKFTYIEVYCHSFFVFQLILSVDTNHSIFSIH